MRLTVNLRVFARTVDALRLMGLVGVSADTVNCERLIVNGTDFHTPGSCQEIGVGGHVAVTFASTCYRLLYCY